MTDPLDRFKSQRSKPRTVFAHGKAIEVETLEPATPAKRKHKPFKADFVMIPISWIEALRRTKNVHAYALAFAVLAERHKRKYVGGEVVCIV